MIDMNVTEKETQKDYIDLRRMLYTGKAATAAPHAVRLAKNDDVRMWKFLREYTSTDLAYKETNPLLVVHALHQSWLLDNNEAFLVHAILILAEATKAESALNYYNKYK